MRRSFYIVFLCLVALSSCGPRRISRADMEEIIYEMLLQDQQIKIEPQLKPEADTSLVYEGIFEAFGYDTDDFLYSLEYYLEEPVRMEKVMESVGKRLEKEIEEVGGVLDAKTWRDRMMRIYHSRRDSSSLPRPRGRAVDSLPLRFQGDTLHLVVPQDSLPVPHPDSLLFVRDSL